MSRASRRSSNFLPRTFVQDFHDSVSVLRMPYLSFGHTDMEVSKLSFGAAGFSRIYGKYNINECKETLIAAIKAGVNYIDTAPWYGQGTSEETLGICLEEVPRNSYYIATKVGRYETDPNLMFDYSAEKTRQSIDESLQRLKLDYVDVIQVHDIEFAPSLEYVIKETLPVLEAAVKSGKARYIGITGYPLSTLAEFIKISPIKIHTVLSYSRFTLFDNALISYLPSFKGMGVINAAALGMGLLTNVGPEDWHPAGDEIRKCCKAATDYCRNRGADLARLAMYYAYKEGNTFVHLAGMKRLTDLEGNLSVLLDGLMKDELIALDYLEREVFSKLEVHNWEGVEIARLKELMKKENRKSSI